jgi:CO/xanthine dehydrogenase FAD-binding subunit
MAIAKVSVGFLAREEGGVLSDVRIALGAVAPTVCGAPETAAYLEGRRLDLETIGRAAEMVCSEARPIADVRSTVEYRREMVGVLLAKGLRSFLE